jgi:glutaredoxin
MAAERFLSAKGVQFVGKDVLGDEAAREEMTKLSGQRGTPVILIDGEVVVGFDRGKMKRLLGL